MSKEISFSEFLKEGAFKEEEVTVSPEQVVEKPIHIEPDVPASEKELKLFWKQVRHFFRTGDRPEGLNGMLVPALLAPYLKAGNYTNDYPVFISKDGETCVPLVNLIQNSFDKCFKEDEAKILRANLPRILRDFKAEVNSKKHYANFADAWQVAEADLKKVDVHGDKQKIYLDHINALKAVLPTDGFVLRFTDETPFLMLKIQFDQLAKKRKLFFDKIGVQIKALEEFLKAESNRKATKDVEKEESGFDFAEELISFDKVGKMMPTEGTMGLTTERKERIKNVVGILKLGIESWMQFSANVVVTEALFKQFECDELFEGARVIEAGVNEGYKLTETTFDSSVKEFAQFIAAQRTATLELKDGFKEDVHVDFFNHFSWHRLTREELQYFPQVVFVGETHGFLKNNLARFSALLSLNKPIRLFAIDKRLVNAPNPDINWEDASHGYRQELAAIAIAHRSTHTFQCAINQPIEVFEGMKKCLAVDSPSIMHFLIPDTNEVKLTEVLKLSAAVEGRFFPSITYDLSEGNKWGSRFDISSNPNPELNWPNYECTFVDVDGEQKTQTLAFTYADYKAVTKEKVEELMLIPESFKSDDLIQIEDYLSASVEELTGKVPYIWLVNEDNCLKRAALPYMWVVSCQERLENWNYIQELGGVNSYHVTKALTEEKAKWEADKAKELKTLQSNFETEKKEATSKAARESMERLTNVLLGLDSLPTATAVKAPAAPVKKEVPAQTKKEVEKKLVVEKKVEEDAGGEAWLETFKCTTCNECTDKYPHIFKYNEDKQAEIKENHKGKFSELVLAAEECPASCIHPGKPANPKEKDVDEFIKRAAKFN